MLPAINLGIVLASVESQMNEDRLKHRACVHERRMHRNMEGFCIYQAYLRRLRSLHRAYVNKYKQLASKQGQPTTSSSQQHRYQQHQQQQRQRQQMMRWSFVPDGSPVKQCSHLKCCHDEERRRHAGLLHLGNKFCPESVGSPSEECLLHEPIPTRKLEMGSLGLRENRKTPETAERRQFRLSHNLNEDHHTRTISSTKFSGPDGKSSECESYCCCSRRCNPTPLFPSLQSKIETDDGACRLKDRSPYPASNAANFTVKSDPGAIRIPCGREGSFCEPERPPQVSRVSLKLEKATPLTKPLQRLEQEVLPFRAWKRRHDKLGGAFYITDLNSLHHT